MLRIKTRLQADTCFYQAAAAAAAIESTSNCVLGRSQITVFDTRPVVECSQLLVHMSEPGRNKQEKKGRKKEKHESLPSSLVVT
jgi:hypothetical protein